MKFGVQMLEIQELSCRQSEVLENSKLLISICPEIIRVEKDCFKMKKLELLKLVFKSKIIRFFIIYSMKLILLKRSFREDPWRGVLEIIDLNQTKSLTLINKLWYLCQMSNLLMNGLNGTIFWLVRVGFGIFVNSNRKQL